MNRKVNAAWAVLVLLAWCGAVPAADSPTSSAKRAAVPSGISYRAKVVDIHASKSKQRAAGWIMIVQPVDDQNNPKGKRKTYAVQNPAQLLSMPGEEAVGKVFTFTEGSPLSAKLVP